LGSGEAGAWAGEPEVAEREGGGLGRGSRRLLSGEAVAWAGGAGGC
jgi:hypothetical protein